MRTVKIRKIRAKESSGKEQLQLYLETKVLKTLYLDAFREKWKARNQLVIEKIKSKEKQKYLEAYQKLYLREALRNDRRTKESAVC